MNEGKSVATAEEVACPGGLRQALAEIERLALRMYDEVLDSRRWRAFGRAELEGCPAVYCQPLSQGWTREWVQTSLGEVGRAIGSAERDVGNDQPLMLSRAAVTDRPSRRYR